MTMGFASCTAVGSIMHGMVFSLNFVLSLYFSSYKYNSVIFVVMSSDFIFLNLSAFGLKFQQAHVMTVLYRCTTSLCP